MTGAQNERFSIMERTQRGRIKRAREGLPWSANPPVGRDYDEEKKVWYVTEKGREIKELILRYLEGEKSFQLCHELGVPPVKISQWVHYGQIAGVYKARFHCPDFGIDEEVPVPAIPEIVSQAMLEWCKTRVTFNRTNNRHDVEKYHLTGFLRCPNCGRALSGHHQKKSHKTYCHCK